MCVEHFFQGGQLARVFFDAVTIPDAFHKGIDLTKGHLAIGHLDLDIGAIVVLHKCLHLLVFNAVDYASHVVLNDQLSKHIGKVNWFSLFNLPMEPIQKTKCFEFISVVKLLVVTFLDSHFILPEIELLKYS